MTRLKRSLLATTAVSTLLGAALLATAGSSIAAPSYKFRLSNFSATVASICVLTDAERECANSYRTGQSEIFDVQANDLNSWYCVAAVLGGGTVVAGPFSRWDYKECALRGTTADAWIELIRP